MKAEELRIGNYVVNDFKKYNGFPVYIDKVTALRLHGEVNVWTCPIDRAYEGTSAMMISGIELTEYFLYRFGFEKINNVNSETYPDFRLNSVELLSNVNGGYVLNRGAGFTHIIYVHQLQNIYYALTGEELTIKTDNA
jgi:hypothetical protein